MTLVTVHDIERLNAAAEEARAFLIDPTEGHSHSWALGRAETIIRWLLLGLGDNASRPVVSDGLSAQVVAPTNSPAVSPGGTRAPDTHSVEPAAAGTGPSNRPSSEPSPFDGLIIDGVPYGEIF